MMWLKKLTVLGLSRSCVALDNLPGVWKDENGMTFVRHSQCGCLLGLAEKSAQLDEKWNTGVWKEVT